VPYFPMNFKPRSLSSGLQPPIIGSRLNVKKLFTRFEIWRAWFLGRAVDDVLTKTFCLTSDIFQASARVLPKTCDLLPCLTQDISFSACLTSDMSNRILSDFTKAIVRPPASATSFAAVSSARISSNSHTDCCTLRAVRTRCLFTRRL
jgi:hypothetical protein